jgi:hypothetical protein
MFPADWTAYSGRSKRAKTAVPDPLADELTESPMGVVSDLTNSVKRSLNQDLGPVEPPELGVEYVLSRVPYRDILENLFGNDGGMPELPIITKSYEESFMRQVSTPHCSVSRR